LFCRDAKIDRILRAVALAHILLFALRFQFNNARVHHRHNDTMVTLDSFAPSRHRMRSARTGLLSMGKRLRPVACH
jgi:hypothetical protein